MQHTEVRFSLVGDTEKKKNPSRLLAGALAHGTHSAGTLLQRQCPCIPNILEPKVKIDFFHFDIIFDKMIFNIAYVLL
jgi:hypothetical protein